MGRRAVNVLDVSNVHYDLESVSFTIPLNSVADALGTLVRTNLNPYRRWVKRGSHRALTAFQIDYVMNRLNGMKSTGQPNGLIDKAAVLPIFDCRDGAMRFRLSHAGATI